VDRYILKLRQAMPLDMKIKFTNRRIQEWINVFGKNGCYVSFSGGKDSTVLLDMVRRIEPETEAVFVDTGLEYPEIRQFVKSFENITILRPQHRFDEVIKKYGYPIISKEISEIIEQARICLQRNDGKYSYRLQKLLGTAKDKSGKKSIFCCEKWQFLLDAPFKISNKCCNVMKKKPVHNFYKQTGKVPFVGTMACESRLREQQYLKTGCNGFNNKIPTSTPIAFWTEQDILQYLKEFNIPFCSVYGEIKQDNTGKYYSTGCQRTGCMFCGYGCHLEKYPNRFQKMATTHPKQYEYCLNQLGMREVLEYIGIETHPNIEHNGQMNIFGAIE